MPKLDVSATNQDDPYGELHLLQVQSGGVSGSVLSTEKSSQDPQWTILGARMRNLADPVSECVSGESSSSIFCLSQQKIDHIRHSQSNILSDNAGSFSQSLASILICGHNRTNGRISFR